MRRCQKQSRQGRCQCFGRGRNYVAELNGNSSNAMIRAYTYTPSADENPGEVLFIRQSNNQIDSPIYDGTRNVSYLVNGTTGNLDAIYEYSAYGNLLSSTGTRASENPLRFSGKYCDSETDLYYYGYRYYNSSLGRWISRDPIEEQGGLNLYGFVNNDPVNRVDYLGNISVEKEREFKKAGYLLWRDLRVTEPEWREVLDNWYYELGPDEVTYSGISDPRNTDIASNPGFVKLLNCWIAKKRGDTVPSGNWIVNDSGFLWKYTYKRYDAAGGFAAYRSDTEFLGSYKAEVKYVGRSSLNYSIGNYEIRVTNKTGWTSGTRLPGFARKVLSWFGHSGTSIFYDHDRKNARYSPSTGGTMSQHYEFITSASRCAECILP